MLAVGDTEGVLDRVGVTEGVGVAQISVDPPPTRGTRASDRYARYEEEMFLSKVTYEGADETYM